MTRRITKKDGADAVATTARRTPRKHSALRDDKLQLRVVKDAPKVTKSARVYAEFDKGASLTEAAKATGVEPAYVWDLAASWQKRTGKQVPRNGRVAKVTTAKETK
jgi:hypothetical protein